MEIAGNLTVGTRSLSKLLYIFASQLDSKIKTDSSLLRVTEENMSIRLVDKDYQVRELVTDYISKLIDSENSELISDGLLQNAFALVLDPEAEVRAAALKLAMKTYSQKNQRFFMMKAQLTTDTLHRLLGDSHSLVRMCAIDFLTCVVISLNVDTDNLYRAYLFAFDKGTLGALSADTECGVQLRLISLLEVLLASLFTVFSGIGRFCHNCNASLILGLMDLDLHKSLIAFTKNFLRLVRSNATDALVRLRPLAQMDQSAATRTSSNFCVQCKANQNPSRIGYVSVDLNCLHKSVANLVQDFGLHCDALDFDGLMESNKSESVYGELFDPGLFTSTSVSSELGDSAHINVLDCY
ncbi:hypothetical protein AX774_g2652 [Zancudomyces culisetae]|uniref:Uncharacterized protein n=1 Tax=Zancudomyces culisetae TaxID=1213189 RepID=A0A1R1PSI3_ZANCU|nr:hypothetical protein AX774_g2652 [Zancudomyces culisetae]|eukprot:OMH83842.1 hypothetical protein AX774_g2652 [Zancudomyces culisetae]